MESALGAKETVKVDMRVISASNKDLRRLLEESLFREDLSYRLAVITVSLPTLRERREDIPLLVDHFLCKHAEEKSVPVKEISEEAVISIARRG